MNFHLAHANIAWMHGTMDEPVMSGLVRRIDEINRLAEESKGFVWRVPDGEATPESFEVFRADFPGFDPARFFYNMSVWESVEDLRAYTLHSAHGEMVVERRQWLDSLAGANVALWWIPVGHHPTVAESAERLRQVRESGPTPYAFTLRRWFAAEQERPRSGIHFDGVCGPPVDS
jgi:hypothetical protein